MPVDLTVTLRLGTRELELSVLELSRALGADPSALREALLRLLLAARYPQEEGDYRGRSFISDRNGNGIQDLRSVEPFREEGGVGEGGASAVDIAEAYAWYFAERLDDPTSIAWYRIVAVRVPRQVAHAALVRALDLPAARIRRSRAAVFTALVRDHVRSHSPISPESPC